MQAKDWAELLEKIPPVHRDGLGLVTTSGVSININSVMRTEDQYLVIRGRLTGTTDANQTFFIPYRQIDFLVFLRTLKEAEVQAWFGDVPAADGQAAPATAETPPAPEGAPPAPAPAPAGQPLATATPAAGALPGHKAAILDRLRKRTGSAPGTIKKPPLGTPQGNVPRPPLGGSPPGGAPKPPDKQ